MIKMKPMFTALLYTTLVFIFAPIALGVCLLTLAWIDQFLEYHGVNNGMLIFCGLSLMAIFLYVFTKIYQVVGRGKNED